MLCDLCIYVVNMSTSNKKDVFFNHIDTVVHIVRHVI